MLKPNTQCTITIIGCFKPISCTFILIYLMLCVFAKYQLNFWWIHGNSLTEQPYPGFTIIQTWFILKFTTHNKIQQRQQEFHKYSWWKDMINRRMVQISVGYKFVNLENEPQRKIKLQLQKVKVRGKVQRNHDPKWQVLE